ncbi:MAG: hypothetical protein U0694_15080 [Anaerolineae bacterium]
MDAPHLKHEITQLLDDLDESQLQQVLGFTQQLRQFMGTPAEIWLEKMGTFGFESADLAEMAQAIAEGCEQVDWESWQ